MSEIINRNLARVILGALFVCLTIAMEHPKSQLVQFTKIGESTETANDQQIINTLVHLIANEQEKIEGALYDLTQPIILKALNDAITRGITVAIYVDRKNYTKNKLNQYTFIHPVDGPSILGSYAGLMHEKFLVFYKNPSKKNPARQIVCYGSWNPTDHKKYPTCDEFIFDINPKIIESFKREIRHLAEVPVCGAASAPAAALAADEAADTLAATAISYPRILFSPAQRELMPSILCTLIESPELQNCKSAMTWLSNIAVAQAIYNTAQTKETCLIVDQDSFAKSNIAWRIPHSFVYAGTERMMHHKFFIFTFKDKPALLWSGSWNCSHGATNYDCVVIREEQLIREFSQRFAELLRSSLRSVNKSAFGKYPALIRYFEKNKRFFDRKKTELANACSDVETTELAPCIKEFLATA